MTAGKYIDHLLEKWRKTAIYVDSAAFAADYAAAYPAYAADAIIKNQKETSDICVNLLGDLIIEKVKSKLS